MRILELSLRNYRVFEKVDLELPARVIGIFGSNGSGKSTLVESIAFALYGRARTRKDAIRTQGVLTDCEVRLAFEHGGRQYEVRRALKGRAHAPDAELWAGGLQLATGASEVDAELQRLLHMDLAVFRASVFAEQKQLDAFSDVTAGKRKEMALRLLGIRPVDDARTAARRDARSARLSVEQLAPAVADIRQLEEGLATARRTEADAKQARSVAIGELEEATAGAKAARAAFERGDAVRQRVEKLQVELTALGERAAKADEDREALVERVETMAKAVDELPAAEEELAALEGVEERLRSAQALQTASATFSKLERQLVGMPEVDAEAALEALATTEQERRGASDEVAEASVALEAATEALAQATERSKRADEADPDELCPTCGRQLGSSFAAYRKHRARELAKAKKARSSIERRLRSARTRATRADAALEKAAAEGERARRASARREQLAASVEEARGQLDALVEAVGPDADVQALRAEARRASRLLGRVAALASDREHLRRAEADLERMDRERGSLHERIAALAGEASTLTFDRDEHARLDTARTEAERGLERAWEAERAASEQLGRAEAELRGIQGEVKQARQTQQRVAELREDARYLERVAMLLDGFRDHLASRVGPELSREAEALFRELTNHEYDDLRIDEETLAVQIADGDAYFPIERFSGSEADLANLALRVAISLHLSRVSGADLGMMVLDEVIGSLDAERKDLLVQVMGRLSNRFHQLFVITHADQVKDGFPASIDVRKVGRRRSVAALA